MIILPGGAGSDNSNTDSGGSAASGISADNSGALVKLATPYPSTLRVAPNHGKDAAILLNGVDVSRYLNEYDVSNERDTAESTTFQSPGDTKTFEPGLQAGTMDATGIYDGTTGAIDDVLAAVDAAGAVTNLFVAFPLKGLVTNSNCWFCAGIVGKIERKSPLNGITTLTYSAQASGEQSPLLHGTGQNAIAVVETGNGPTCDVGRVPVGGGVGFLAVTANTRDAGSLAVKLEYSSDGTTWAQWGDTLTLDAGSANVGALVLQQNATAQRYFRVVATVTSGTSGSYTLAYGFAPF